MSEVAPDNALNETQLVATSAEGTPSDADLVATLRAEVDELRLLVADLELSWSSAQLSLCILMLALVCLGAVLTLIVAPTLVPGASANLPTIAAFLTVILTYFTYVAYKRFVIDLERSRRHRATLARANHLLVLAIEVLRDATGNPIELRAI